MPSIRAGGSDTALLRPGDVPLFSNSQLRVSLDRHKWRMTDKASAGRAVRYISTCLVLPFALANLYTIASRTQFVWTEFLHITVWACVVAATFFFVATRLSGEYLIMTLWLVGLINESGDIGYNHRRQHEGDRLTPLAWIFVAALNGLISGVLCKAKDIDDDHYTEDYNVSERLYLMVPYTVGVWTGHVVANGWIGLMHVFASVFFSLAAIGYGTLLHRFLKTRGVYSVNLDLIELVNQLFTASFGKVMVVSGAMALVIFYVVLPFALNLARQNTLVSAIGIIIEIVIYDLA